MGKGKKTVYIGAHPDDISIGESIAIKRDPENSRVLTITDGVVRGGEWPRKIYGVEFKNPVQYGAARLAEEKIAMELLNLDFENHYVNGQVPDKQTYLYIKKIVDLIDGVVKSSGVERIVTHSLPEAHPDHEVVSMCSHYVGQQRSIPVWEYPLYVLDADGNEVVQQFLDDDFLGERAVIDYSSDEFSLREQVLRVYDTQEFVRRTFNDCHSELFRRTDRDLGNLPTGTGYYYGDDPTLPTPADIRKTFTSFIKDEERR